MLMPLPARLLLLRLSLKSECAANNTEKKKTRKSRLKHAASHPAAGVLALPQDVKADAPERAACPSPLNAQHFSSDPSAALHHVHFSASKYSQCANPDGSAYPVRIERTQFHIRNDVKLAQLVRAQDCQS